MPAIWGSAQRGGRGGGGNGPYQVVAEVDLHWLVVLPVLRVEKGV